MQVDLLPVVRLSVVEATAIRISLLMGVYIMKIRELTALELGAKEMAAEQERLSKV